MPNIGRINAVKEILTGAPQRISRIFWNQDSRNSRLEDLAARAARQGIPVQPATPRQLERLSPHNQGLVAVTSPKGYATVESMLAADQGADTFLVLLDGVEDPQNLGAILRTAEGAGVDGVILPEKRSAGLTPTVYTVSAGAAEHVPVARVKNLARTMEALKRAGLWLVGAEGGAKRTWDSFDYRVPLGLVLGSEGKGLRPLVRSKCDALLSLPLAGRISSLNVAAAAAVFLYEVVRQRRGEGDPAKPI